MDTTPLIDGRSRSLEMCRMYLGKIVSITIDQAYGTVYKGIVYEANYGFVPGTTAPDGDGLDAYYLGEKKPLTEVSGKCVAIIHRHEDDDDKLVLVPEGEDWSDEQIEAAVTFSEHRYIHSIVRS